MAFFHFWFWGGGVKSRRRAVVAGGGAPHWGGQLHHRRRHGGADDLPGMGARRTPRVRRHWPQKNRREISGGRCLCSFMGGKPPVGGCVYFLGETNGWRMCLLFVFSRGRCKFSFQAGGRGVWWEPNGSQGSYRKPLVGGLNYKGHWNSHAQLAPARKGAGVPPLSRGCEWGLFNANSASLRPVGSIRV